MLPASLTLPPPYPPFCQPGATTFRLEQGSSGAVDGLLRRGLVGGSPEEALADELLGAVGLSLGD